MTPVIRKLNTVDAPAFCRIKAEGVLENPYIFERTLEEIMNMSHEAAGKILSEYVIFGAFIDGEIVGICGFFVRSLSKQRHRGFLGSLYVKKEYRGRGLGGAMIERTIAHVEHHMPYIEQMKACVETTNVYCRNILDLLNFQYLFTESRAVKCGGLYQDICHYVKHIDRVR